MSKKELDALLSEIEAAVKEARSHIATGELVKVKQKLRAVRGASSEALDEIADIEKGVVQ